MAIWKLKGSLIYIEAVLGENIEAWCLPKWFHSFDQDRLEDNLFRLCKLLLDLLQSAYLEISITIDRLIQMTLYLII